ncbi:DISARM system helicase DrmA [Persephonella sp.]
MALIDYIKDIYCDVLGPRNLNPEEILETQNPRNEFITGILSSSNHRSTINSFTENESLPDKLDEEDIEASADIEPLSSSLLNPVLNPQKLPVSIGLSFVVETDRIIEFDVCITWGKYFLLKEDEKSKSDSSKKSENSKRKWIRRSFYYIEEGIRLEKDDSKKEFYINRDIPDNKLRLKIEKRPESDSRFFISVYLINESDVAGEYKDRVDPPTEYLIFQPQIRIKMKQGNLSNLYSKILDSGIEEEERIYEFPYSESNILALAKGNMCAAIWKEIDPLQENPERFDFMWIDGKTIKNLDEAKFKKFLECDLRTEFLPLIPQGIPDFSIEGIDFDPEELSEISPEKLDGYFGPFLQKYKNWISQKEKEIHNTSNPELASKIIDKHKVVYERIKKGISLMKKDKEVLLCFNFSNKVISIVQKEWNKKENFRWRPFQLAFFLMTLESLVNPDSEDRDYIDILWVPTGGGKTEAYLAISAFLLAYRRRIKKDIGYGTAIISRYTLRLLTVQQFTRTLKTITACEYLRVLQNKYGKKGWLPEWAVVKDDFVWEKYRFSAGLWVGGAITPNKLHTSKYRSSNGYKEIYGALDLLKKHSTVHKLSKEKGKEYEIKKLRNQPEAALLARCPVCGGHLSIPEEGVLSESSNGEIRLNFIVKLHGFSGEEIESDIIEPLKSLIEKKDNFDFELEKILKVDEKEEIFCMKIYILTGIGYYLKPEDIINIWEKLESAIRRLGYDIKLMSLSPDKPGYFPWGKIEIRGNKQEIDFAILCPDVNCPLNQHRWDEYVPVNDKTGFVSIFDTYEFKNFSWMRNFIPVPAYFIDEQIYSRLPSIIISTVDKFARLPFEPATGSIFGNVDFYHPLYGFYRKGAIYSARRDIRPPYVDIISGSVSVNKPEPPELIIQDELHLIEGPLGSLAGLYETIVDELCRENTDNKKLKYIASTATIKHAEYQTDALFLRKAFQFPPVGLSINDNFFSKIEIPSLHKILSEENVPGKIYIGLMSPGKGPLTPQVRLYSRLWLTDKIKKNNNPIVGYYNAVRELAGGRRILEQDIKERLKKDLGFKNEDNLPKKTDILELSSRMDSDEISLLIEQLEKEEINPHFIITTSVFGTGVDIPHLRFMVVNGQPKTTATYIQATGRVGRKNTALVITFYRSTRPRDLSHYEFFTGYHLALYRYVEETSVFPFSKGCIYKGNGPVIVGIMRNSRNSKHNWTSEESAQLVKNWDHDRDIQHDFYNAMEKLLERNNRQKLKMDPVELESIIKDRNQGLDKWKKIAREKDSILFVEYIQVRNPVVLGDIEHEKIKGEDFVVYRRVPNSLRNIEDTIEIDVSFY